MRSELLSQVADEMVCPAAAHALVSLFVDPVRPITTDYMTVLEISDEVALTRQYVGELRTWPHPVTKDEILDVFLGEGARLMEERTELSECGELLEAMDEIDLEEMRDLPDPPMPQITLRAEFGVYLRNRRGERVLVLQTYFGGAAEDPRDYYSPRLVAADKAFGPVHEVWARLVGTKRWLFAP